MTEIIKNLVFILIIAAAIVLFWIAAGSIAQKHFHTRLDWLGKLAIALPATGILGWIIFIIYFTITA